MTKQTTLLIAIIVGVITLVGGGLIGFGVGYSQGAINNNINTYEECAAAGYPIQESYPEKCTVPGGKTFTKELQQGKPVTFKGKVICLLHKDTEGPQTKECASGLQTDEGKYYTLNTSQIDASLTSDAGSDKRIWIEGTLKSEASDRYQSEGVITVTDFEFIE